MKKTLYAGYIKRERPKKVGVVVLLTSLPARTAYDRPFGRCIRVKIPHQPQRGSDNANVKQEGQNSMSNVDISNFENFFVDILVPRSPDWVARKYSDAENGQRDGDAEETKCVEDIHKPRGVTSEDSFVEKEH